MRAHARRQQGLVGVPPALATPLSPNIGVANDTRSAGGQAALCQSYMSAWKVPIHKHLIHLVEITRHRNGACQEKVLAGTHDVHHSLLRTLICPDCRAWEEDARHMLKGPDLVCQLSVRMHGAPCGVCQEEAGVRPDVLGPALRALGLQHCPPAALGQVALRHSWRWWGHL